MNLADVITRGIKSYARSSIYTSLPATVVRVIEYENQQAVDVRPLVARRREDDVVIPPQTIEGVPVVLPGAGGGVLTFPVKVGDIVLVVFSMRSIDEWVSGTGEPSEPISSRSHSMTDAIAIPGLCTFGNNNNPNPDDVELKFMDTLFLRMQQSGNIILESTQAPNSVTLSNNGDIVFKTAAGTLTFGANGDVTHFSGAKISANGDIYSPTKVSAPVGEFGSSLKAGGKEIINHTHSGVQSGNSNTGPNN